jgi:hypothetical protein
MLWRLPLTIATAIVLFALGGPIIAAFVLAGFYGRLFGSGLNSRSRNFGWLRFGRIAATFGHD